MRTVRKLGMAVMVVTALMLAGCTTSTVGPTGVVTGVADACVGDVIPPGEVLHVKVSLDSGSNLVASTTVRSGARYRFSVVPGEYRLTGWWGSKSVAVRAGRAVTVKITNVCI
jgi:hypothetical protein